MGDSWVCRSPEPGAVLRPRDARFSKGRGTRADAGCAAIHGHRKETHTMLSWAITFLIIALIAAVLGFGGVAGTAAGIAKILFFVFLVLFIVSLISGRRGPAA